MANKLNGTAKWIGLGILIITNIAAIAYNVGVTNEKITTLSFKVEELRESVDEMDANIDGINISLAAR